ncbi:MAG: hypothetical protein ACRDQB_00350, partial [Thermocrispum sp.]
TGAGIGAGIGDFFGSKEQSSAAVDGAKSFRDAAKSGQFAVDPDKAESAIKDLVRAEEQAQTNMRTAQKVPQRLPIGGSPFASVAADAYQEGGESAYRAAQADIKVLQYYREGVEAAMKNYRRMDDDVASSFGGNA